MSNYDRGYEAYCNGNELIHCPHDEGSPSWFAWQDGWRSAEADEVARAESAAGWDPNP